MNSVYKGAAARMTVAVNLAVLFMGSTLISPLYPLYQRRFGFAELTLTLIYAVYVTGNLAALLFLGRLSDQIGRRRASLPAIGLACVSTVIFLIASGTSWLFAARALSGLAVGLASGACTAWIAELTESPDKSGATVTAAAATMIGLSIGPLMGGLLAQYAPAPLHLCFAIYLAVLITVAWIIRRTQETVERPFGSLWKVSLRPRFCIPRETRARFVSPAMTAFATFALGGFFAALVPTIVIQELNEHRPAIGGNLVFECFLAAFAAVIVTSRLRSRTAMLTGLALLVPSLFLLALAQEFRSLPVLIASTAVTGLAVALGYRGSLQVINRIAPPERRAEVISGYLVACYLGNSLPVIGVGVLSRVFDLHTATVTFMIVILLCVTGAFVMGVRLTDDM